MKGNTTVLLSGLVAMIMVTCAVPFFASEESDALIGNTNGMHLNTDSAILYQTDGTDRVYLSIVQSLPGDNPSAARWYLNDLDDGTAFVQLSSTSGSSVTVSVNPQVVISGAMSVEVVAEIGTHHASAVIVAYPCPAETALVFHYFFKIDESAIEYLIDNEQISEEDLILPEFSEGNDIFEGFWVDVPYTNEMGISSGEFNALSALQWYLDENGWDNEFGYYGWINTLLGLGTYSGPDNYDEDGNYLGSTWYYWAQYHAETTGSANTWVFNNTTLEFITTVGESYIGMIFWGSPDADTMPSPFPGFPTA